MARTVWSKNQEHEEEGDFGEGWMRREFFFEERGWERYGEADKSGDDGKQLLKGNRRSKER